jgi:hypothetical protein
MSGYPQPPEDPDVRNIIDKLANFVARNGPEFEEMTKSKQISNPKFSFLFGGEYHAYYKWKVAAEQGGLCPVVCGWLACYPIFIPYTSPFPPSKQACTGHLPRTSNNKNNSSNKSQVVH